MRKTTNVIARRYLMFLVSLFIIAFGTSLSIRANLGSSPISCPPDVLSLVPGIGLTMGTLVFCVHAVLVMLQIAILRRKYQPLQLLQLFVGIVFGFFTDLTMWMTGYLQIMDDSPLGYSLRFMELLCGGAILAYGIAIEVKCDVLMLATEGTQVVIARTMGKEFGVVKMVTDTLLVVVGVVFCFLFFGQWRWELIGPGTLVSMFYVGFMVRIFSPRLRVLDRWLMNRPKFETGTAPDKERHDDELPLVITISREYGSGGHHIGTLLAERLGIPLYDRQLINETAKALGFTCEYVAENEQNISTRRLWEAIFTDKSIPESMNPSREDAIFVDQTRIIRKLAAEKSCIIIGRCANWVLRHRKNVLRVFVCSDLKTAVREIMAKDHLDDNHAKDKIERVNKARANYYLKYIGHSRTDCHGYDLVINTSKTNHRQAAELIERTIEADGYKIHKKPERSPEE